MLKCFINDYLIYCKSLALSQNAIKELSRYIKHLDDFLKKNGLEHITQVQYKHLVAFTVSDQAGPATLKARIWALKKFFCWLLLKDHIKDNPAKDLSPPKIPKKEARFLSKDELKVIFIALSESSHTPTGLRDFLIISLMAVCGLRKSSVVALDREDFDLQNHTLALQEKGLPGRRTLPIPAAMCRLLDDFTQCFNIHTGPLFTNRNKRRLKPDGVNKIVTALKKRLLSRGHNFAKTLHPHIFRHSAATQLNEVASFTVVKEMLGHRNTQNTRKYIHLSHSSYGAYMKRHPYFDTARQNYFSNNTKGGII